MRLPLSLFIGLRYVRARRQQFFVSFISWVSMLGICVGVAALITILSIMTGLESEARSRLLSLGAHATLSENPRALVQWPGLVAQARRVPGVTGAAPYVELQALLTHEAEPSGAVVRGIDPAAEPEVSTIGRSMVEGSFDQLTPGSRRIVIGKVLAYQLSLQVGESVTVMVPVGGAGNDAGDEGAPGGDGAAGAGGGILNPRIQSFTVAGIFEVGLQEHDGGVVLMHLSDAAALVGLEGATGIRLRFDDVFAAPDLAQRVAASLGGGFHVSDWTREHASYFRAIRIEKTMMALIMMLIVVVAAFNIVAMLVMVVTDKRTDIAILRTLGLKPNHIVGVFITQGVVIGWLGAALGVAAGLALALNVETIVPWLERTFHFYILDPDVYYITQIPSETHALDVVLIAGAAFLLTVLATLYPALRAARIEPAEALRYE